jgi:4-hydroxy-2-oxoheptanedioate aldolase
MLDFGAEGIMFPRVDSAAEAEKSVAGLRYPPGGVRGVAAANRACSFGIAFEEYMEASASTLLGVTQIESERALADVDAIAAVDGVDVLFVGPMDLTQSLGVVGRIDHPRYGAALETVSAAAHRHGKSLGVLMAQPDDFDRYHRLGFRLIACASDGTLLNAAARRQMELLAAVRAHRTNSS